VKNIFSATEEAPQLDPAFHNQPQAGAQPTAPATNPHLPEPAPVPLRIPEHEKMAEHAGMRVDWKNTPIE